MLTRQPPPAPGPPFGVPLFCGSRLGEMTMVPDGDWPGGVLGAPVSASASAGRPSRCRSASASRSALRRRRRAGGLRVHGLTDVRRRRELLDLLALQRRRHERRPDPRRVLAAEERRQPADAVEVGPAGALVEVDRGRQLRGEARRTRPRSWCPAAVRPCRSCRPPAGRATAPRYRCRSHDLLQRVAEVGHHVLVEGPRGLRLRPVAGAAVGALDLLHDVPLRGLALRREGRVGGGHVDVAHRGGAERW